MNVGTLRKALEGVPDNALLECNTHSSVLGKQSYPLDSVIPVTDLIDKDLAETPAKAGAVVLLVGP